MAGRGRSETTADGAWSLLGKLMLAWAASVLAAMVAMLLVLSVQKAERIGALNVEHAQTLLAVIETQSRRAAAEGDLGLMAEAVRGMTEVGGIGRVSMYHAPTQSYIRSDLDWPHSINQPPEALDRQVLATGVPGRTRSGTGLRLAAPLRSSEGGPVDGVVAIEIALPDRSEIALEFFLGKVATGGIAMFAALVLAFAFAQNSVRPIRAAIRVADRVAEGDLAMPEHIGGSREAVQLERSLSRMIFRLEQSHLRIRDLAFRDQVTRLSNRTDFNLRGRALLRGEGLGEPRMLRALFFLDLDGFKEINDTYGHEMGDQALRRVADRLREVVRPDDELRTAPRIAGALGDRPEVAPLLARLGGDEFTLLLSCLAAPTDAGLVAERVLVAIRRPMEIDGRALQLGVSIGIALSEPGGVEDFSELLRRADVAMYAAKRAGKDRFMVYEAGMDRSAA